MMIHAEVNAILFAAQPLHGCSIYVWPMAPCARCAGLIWVRSKQKKAQPEKGTVNKCGEFLKHLKKFTLYHAMNWVIKKNRTL